MVIPKTGNSNYHIIAADWFAFGLLAKQGPLGIQGGTGGADHDAAGIAAIGIRVLPACCF